MALHTLAPALSHTIVCGVAGLQSIKGILATSSDTGSNLAREGTATMCSPATVCVDDDLAPSQSGITMGASNDEASCQCKRLRLCSLICTQAGSATKWPGTSCGT